MRGIKQCTLFALSFVLLSTVLSIGYSDRAKATAGLFDDFIPIITEQNPTYTAKSPTSCESTLQVGNWQDAFNENIMNRSYFNDVKDSLQYAFEFGAWSVSYQDTVYGTQVTVSWVENVDNSVVTFSGTQSGNRQLFFKGGSTSPLKNAVISNAKDRFGSSYPCQWALVSQNLGISQNKVEIASEYTASGNPLHRLLYSTALVEYPDGYNGQIVPYENYSHLPAVVVRPHIGYEVNNKTIKLRYKKGNFPDTLPQDYKLEVLIVHGTYDDDGNPIQTWQGTIEQDEEVTQPVDKYGQYSVQMYYKDSQGNLYQDSTQYDFESRDILLPLNGESYSGSTGDMECGQNDELCEYVAPSKYEDCETIDVLCHARNVGTWLLSLLGVDKFTEITDNPFSAIQNNTHGLTSVIIAPLAFYDDLDEQGACRGFNLPLPVMGNVTVPCMSGIYSSKFPTLYTIAMTVVNALVGYYVMIRILEIVKGFKDPQSDRIEVVHL